MAINAGSFSTGSTPAASVAVPVPSGVALGDLIMMFVVSQAASMTFADTGDGFTAVGTSGQNCSTGFLYRTATSADVTLSASSGSYTITPSATHSMAGIIVDAPGAAYDPSAPTTGGVLLSAAGTAISSNSVTTLVNGDLLLWFGAVRSPATADSAAITIPSGFSTVVAQVTTTFSTVNVGAILATATQATAGATGAEAGTLGNALDDGGALLVAITQSSGTNANAGNAASTGKSLGEDDSAAAGEITLNMTIRGM
jgi:hypothetical protein